MNNFRSTIACGVFAVAAGFSGVAAATNNIELVFSGLAVGNTSPPPSHPAFATWCAGVCFPTTQQPVYDASTSQQKGNITVWGKNFLNGAGGSLCFSEFIAFALDQGDVYVKSGPTGTCGAPIDPNLKTPLYQDQGALVVVAGGGDGVIAGGTGKYAKWTGTYTDRVFVGFGAPGTGANGSSIIYYDQLWFSITGK
jgi:hypothetical protein